MGGAESVPTREDVLVYTSARAAAAVEALTTNRRSRQQPDINSLDEATLRFILLSATTHDDLLEHIATCACVCPEWWQIVICSPAYGGGWAPDVAGQTLRRQVLQTISHRLLTARTPGEFYGQLFLTAGLKRGCGPILGDAGGRVFGAALRAMPTPLALTMICLGANDLTLAGLAPALASMHWHHGIMGSWELHHVQTGLVSINIADNPKLGDAGIVALASSMPPTVQELQFGNTGCGDEGMAAIAAALLSKDMQRLRALACDRNPMIGAPGWTALAAVCPRLPALRTLQAFQCTGMGDAGVAALAAGLPAARLFERLNIIDCDIGAAGGQTLIKLVAKCPRLAYLHAHSNRFSDAVLSQLQIAVRMIRDFA